MRWQGDSNALGGGRGGRRETSDGGSHVGLGLIMLGGRGGMSGVLCGTRGCIVRGVRRAGLTGDHARLTRAGAGLTRGQPEYREHAGID